MPDDLKCEYPFGARSCALDVTGKEPDEPHRWESIAAYEESGMGVALAGQKEAQIVTAYARIHKKLHFAESGRLKFGRGDRFDVDKMDCTQDVLELKWPNVPNDSKVRKLWLRIYFTEPLNCQGVLLKLLLKCKSDGPRKDQDGDAEEAQRRFDEHVQGGVN